MQKQGAKVEVVGLPELKIGKLEITLVGDTPLISHAWSKKAKKMMLDKQMKKAKPKKDAKDPQKDYEDSLYTVNGGYGFPSIAFKAAAVNACSHVDGVTKVLARGAFHVEGEMVEIAGKPRMREDMVRLANGVADIRYRGEFPTWKARILVRYNKNVLSPEQIMNLFNTAGFAIGIGEWRPQKNGFYGMFHVATQKEV